MIGVETVLPSDQRLEQLVGDFRGCIDQELDEVESGALEDVIDWRIVDPESLKKSESLAVALGFEHPEEKHAMTRGILFARQIIWMVYGTETKCRLPGYLKHTEATDATRETVSRDTQEYLMHKPNLDSFIGYYMPAIAGMGNDTYYHRVEEAVALMFRGAELWRANRYIGDEFESLTPEAFT